MQFLKLGDGTFLRTGLIAGAAFEESGRARVSLAGGGETLTLDGDEAAALRRWLDANSSEVSEDDPASRGVYV